MSSGFATGNEFLRGLPRGETLRGLPREAENFTRLRGQPREAKPFTRKFMAKWEIRFQRFAISFRPSPSPRRNSVKTGVPMAGRRREPLAFAGALVCGLPREAESFYEATSQKCHFPEPFNERKNQISQVRSRTRHLRAFAIFASVSSVIFFSARSMSPM